MVLACGPYSVSEAWQKKTHFYVSLFMWHSTSVNQVETAEKKSMDFVRGRQG
jgi:hypothetical protein